MNTLSKAQIVAGFVVLFVMSNMPTASANNNCLGTSVTTPCGECDINVPCVTVNTNSAAGAFYVYADVTHGSGHTFVYVCQESNGRAGLQSPRYDASPDNCSSVTA